MTSHASPPVSGASPLLARGAARRDSLPAEGATFAPVRFSTHELPERDRLPMWREEFGRAVVRTDIEPLSDLPFRAEATLRVLPGLRTIVCVGSPVRNRRTSVHAADGDDCIGLFVNLGGRATASQRSRDVVLGRCDAVLIRHDASVVTPAPEGFLGVLVPHAALASRVNDIDDATMRLIYRGTEPLRLLVNYMSSLRNELVLRSPKLRRMVVSHIYDLMALAAGSHRDRGEVGSCAVASARRDAALRHISESFENPRLSVATVAHNLQISPRYLQHLLEMSGTSFTARVNELRLQRAFDLLTVARDGHDRISDIALRAGFSDISYFNRLFRSRFGDTPSGVRRQSRGAR